MYSLEMMNEREGVINSEGSPGRVYFRQAYGATKSMERQHAMAADKACDLLPNRFKADHST